MVLTKYKVHGLMAGLLASRDSLAGTTKLGDWLDHHAGDLGLRYVSELRRNYRQAPVGTFNPNGRDCGLDRTLTL